MIKSQDTIRFMKMNEIGVRVLENALSESEVARLLEIHADLNRVTEPSENKSLRLRTVSKDGRRNALNIVFDPRTAATLGQRHDHRTIDELIGPKLPIGDFKYESINFYAIQNAYNIHSDTGLDNGRSYVQGVVPLRLDPPGAETHTLIFDQRVYYSSEYIHPSYKKPPEYKPFHNRGDRDPSVYEGWSDEHKIRDEDCKKYWYNDWIYWRDVHKGFSVKAAYRWKIGDILLFDRSLLHASTLLKEGGVHSKVGLLFTTVKEA